MSRKDENVGWKDGDVTMVTVEAVSKRGKQLIKQYGDRWWLCRIDESLQCFDGDGGVLIAPEGRAWHSHTSRFIRATDWLRWNDPNLRLAESSIVEHSGLTYQPKGEDTSECPGCDYPMFDCHCVERLG